jgi:hypothetical protein
VNPLHELTKGLPPPLQKIATHAGSFLAGLVMAVLLNYVLYRLGLPSKPFIYVAF